MWKDADKYGVHQPHCLWCHCCHRPTICCGAPPPVSLKLPHVMEMVDGTCDSRASSSAVLHLVHTQPANSTTDLHFKAPNLLCIYYVGPTWGTWSWKGGITKCCIHLPAHSGGGDSLPPFTHTHAAAALFSTHTHTFSAPWNYLVIYCGCLSPTSQLSFSTKLPFLWDSAAEGGWYIGRPHFPPPPQCHYVHVDLEVSSTVLSCAYSQVNVYGIIIVIKYLYNAINMNVTLPKK